MCNQLYEASNQLKKEDNWLEKMCNQLYNKASNQLKEEDN